MTRGLFIHCMLTLVLAFAWTLSQAQQVAVNKGPKFTISKSILSVEDGLASHEVFCGIQDDAGFLWFGTRNGLSRFDGENCLLFTHQRQKLQDNKVVCMAKDDANHIFVGYGSTGFKLTTNGKIDVIDASTHQIKTLAAAFPKMPFREQDVYWLSNDGTGEIGFLTANPFRYWKYSSKKGFNLRCEMKDWDSPDVVSSLDYRTTGPFCMFGEGKALLKIFNQFKQYLVTKDTVTAFTQKDALRSLPIGFSSQHELLLTYMTTAEPNKFKIGKLTANGLQEITSHNNRFNTDQLRGKYWQQATNTMDGKSSVFYATRDGIYLWTEKAFLKIIEKSAHKAFENLTVYQLLTDNLKNLWLCTSIGVLKFKIETNRFAQYFTVNQQKIEANNQVRGIYADDSGKVMANVWSHTFLENHGKMQNVSNTKHEINYGFVKHGPLLYLGGYELFAYDPLKNSTQAIPKTRGSEIWSIFSLNDTLLLLGRSDRLSLFNSKSGKSDSVPYTGKNSSVAKFVYRFFRGKDKRIWAVAENGLFNINGALPAKNSKSATADSKRSLLGSQWSASKIQSKFIDRLSLLDAYEDSSGIFWLATHGDGLYRWDRADNSFRQFNMTAGLPSDILYRIEPGSAGDLWISSDYGLIRFDTKTFGVRTYTTADGISNNEFNRTSSFKAVDGRLFFGGLDGVNAFYPKDFAADTNAVDIPLRVISFSQFVDGKNGLVNKTLELLHTNQITLSPDDKFFTLEFQLLDFAKEKMHRYAYKIEGVDKEWIFINENSLRISGLPYGNFILHVKSQNREGVWSRSELAIPITVLKPFYFQWWFLLFAALLIVMAVYFLLQIRLRQLAVDKRKLEQVVSERTAQLKRSLSDQSGLLAEKDVLMKEIHHRVKNNLQVISGLLELQGKMLSDQTAKNALREGQNRVRSMALIHQNSYQFDNLSTIDLKRFVTDLCSQIESVFQKQNRIKTSIIVPELHLDIDTAVPLGLIMNELFSNSFKYAFKDTLSGEISLVVVCKDQGKFQMQYRDNGPGLPAGFDLTNAASLGMRLIHDLTRQIGGTLRYENKGGALFTINFTNREIRKNQD
ncbi:histidine kinase dimerization/phosphoacceptor domain -containing protein [Dyadobacter subterraneus]|uniref:histidine kinase n=1 Tax=Dyadobacter subterraneus TaxID=2773304 RepID=A0ABR9W962_9BACT|nr:histidine kinase dimerization/phosphoacceptor domain -containing protein [Dyadobacter subterraneus]MBE9462012.1 hypothetical protein [Dyadobacter subterraneus]